MTHNIARLLFTFSFWLVPARFSLFFLLHILFHSVGVSETILTLFKRFYSMHAYTDTPKHASTFTRTKGGRDAAGYAQSARSD